MAVVVKVDKSQILSGQTSDSYVVRKQAGSTIIVRSQILDKTKSLRELKDFPDSYTGAAAKVIAVDKNETGVYFKEISPSSLNVYTKEEVNKDIESLQLKKANLKDSNTFTSNQTVKGDITISQNKDKANTTTLKVIDGGLNVDLVNQNESQIVNFNLSNLDQRRSSDKGKDSNSGLIKFQQNKEGTKILVGNDEVLTTETVSKNIPTQGVMEAMRAANNDRFAASGFVHWGKHIIPNGTGYDVINEGMHTDPNRPNQLRLGRRNAAIAVGGKSKTTYPVVNIAGFITKLTGLNLSDSNSYAEDIIEFPEAERGCRVYNAETGQSVDYSTDIDPKYGDVASTLSEAVGRAWEGEKKNGDFRFAGQYWSAQSERGTTTFELGKATVTDTSGLAPTEYPTYLDPKVSMKAGVIYEVEVVVESISDDTATMLRLGSYADPNKQYVELNVGRNVFQYTPAIDTEEGNYIYVGNRATTVFNSFSIRPVTNQVVTERVDLVAIEAFMRPIHKGDHVYPNGCIQSLATKMNGIVTSDDASRPDSFFAMYDGQVGLRGRGVNFHACSANDQDILTNDPDNNIYRMVDGTICQWSIRARTFKGVGNGDWSDIDSATQGSRALSFNDAKNYVWPQGALNGISSGHYFDCTNHGSNTKKHQGIFAARDASALAYNGECYLYVVATVSRLNQGAYALGLNEFGANQFYLKKDGGKTFNKGGWTTQSATYGESPIFTKDVVTPADCFKEWASIGVYGKIGSNSGRPDGRFYDGIYASGLGGVNDLRLSAHKVTAEDYARVDAEVKAGIYRGAEKLKFSRVFSHSATTSYPTSRGMQLPEGHNVKVGDKVHWLGDTGSYQKTLIITNVGEDYANWASSEFTYERVKGTVYEAVIETQLEITVSGDFQMTEVIGSPNNIVKCETLKDGWQGVWNPYMSPLSEHPLVRPAIKDECKLTVSNDCGVSWVSAISKINTPKNTTVSYSANELRIIHYTTFARQVEDCDNSPVLDYKAGIGNVFAFANCNPNWGSLLGESLLGKVLTSNADKQFVSSAVVEYSLRETGELPTWASHALEHQSISKLGNSNNSPAVKCLDTRSAVNDQAYLDYHFKELVWDETSKSWGDESNQMLIGNKTAVMTDNNGNSVLFGTKRLTNPIGWV